MASEYLTLAKSSRDNETPLKDKWTVASDEYDATGGATYDELCYFKADRFNNITVQITELAGEAGTATFYGTMEELDDLDPDTWTLADHWGQLGEAAQTITASSANIFTFVGAYNGILVTVAKTAEGAETGYVTVKVIGV